MVVVPTLRQRLQRPWASTDVNGVNGVRSQSRYVQIILGHLGMSNDVNVVLLNFLLYIFTIFDMSNRVNQHAEFWILVSPMTWESVLFMESCRSLFAQKRHCGLFQMLGSVAIFGVCSLFETPKPQLSTLGWCFVQDVWNLHYQPHLTLYPFRQGAQASCRSLSKKSLGMCRMWAFKGAKESVELPWPPKLGRISVIGHLCWTTIDSSFAFNVPDRDEKLIKPNGLLHLRSWLFFSKEPYKEKSE